MRGLRSAAWRLAIGALVAAACGCGSDATPPAPAPGPCELPSRMLGGSCLAPGTHDSGCEAGTWLDEAGSCVAAGAPATPSCGDGLVAFPGEVDCHAPWPCPTEPWGGIPVDAATVYVSATYAGGDSDGTAERPWTTIGDAVAQAPAGALVAVAAGSYAEDIVVSGKPLSIVGTCPDQVSIQGQGGLATVNFDLGASGSRLAGVALAGATTGLLVRGADGVVVEGVRIHDTSGIGAVFINSGGATGGALIDMLVERTQQVGISASGAAISLERVNVRDVGQADPAVAGGGIFTRAREGTVGQVALTDGVIERANYAGVAAFGAMVSLTRTVLRGAAPGSGGLGGNAGLWLDVHEDFHPALTAQQVTISEHGGIGLFGAAVTVDATRIAIAGNGDRGISVQPSGPQRTQLWLKGSQVAANVEAGIYVSGSDATLEGVWVSDNVPSAIVDSGRGLQIQSDEATNEGSGVDIRGSVVSANATAAVVVDSSTAALSDTRVEATQPSPDLRFGIGVQAQNKDMTGAPSSLTLVRTLIAQNHDVGVMVLASDAAISDSLVTGTLPQASDGLFGDGITLIRSITVPASATIHNSRIVDNGRAGVSVFGATANISALRLACNVFDLALEPAGEVEGMLQDGGENLCGCEQTEECKAVTTGIAPPEAIETL